MLYEFIRSILDGLVLISHVGLSGLLLDQLFPNDSYVRDAKAVSKASSILPRALS